MKSRQFFAAFALLLATSALARAQEKKPGGLNKVAHDVSSTMKKTGRDAKAETKHAASGAHQTLTKAGNDTKAELKRTTGVTTPAPTPEHKPGGVNKLARDVSHASKTTGAKAKHGVKKVASKGHAAATAAGKGAKEEVKKP